MKLILKRIERMVEVTSLGSGEARYIPGGSDIPGPFALHTEDGKILPCQISTVMGSEHGEPVRLTVTFLVDGNKIRVEGDVCEPAN